MAEITRKDGGSVAPKREKRKHNGWKYFLMWFVGFISCIVTIGLAVVITGSVIKLKDLVAMTGGDPNEYVGEEFINDTLLSAITKLTTRKFETLGDLNKVSPIIEKTVTETVNPALRDAIGFEFDWNELSIKPFQLDSSSSRPDTEYDHTESITDYIPRAVESGITLYNFFDDPSDIDGLLEYLCYGLKEEPEGSGHYVIDTDHKNTLYDIMQDPNAFMNNIINAITLGSIVDTSSNPFLAQMNDYTINDLSDMSKITSLEIGPLFDGNPDAANNPLIQTIITNHWTIDDLCDFDNIMSLKISDVLDVSGSSAFLQAIGNNTFNELTAPGFVDGLLLSDLFPDAGGIVKALADTGCTIGELTADNTKILELTVLDVFPDITSGDILYAFKDETLGDLSTLDISTVKITDIFSATDIANNKILSAVLDVKGNDATIGDLSDQTTINSIPLDSIIDPTGNQILTALCSSPNPATIGTIGDKIDTLKLKDVIEADDPTSMIYGIVNSTAMDCPINEIGAHFGDILLSDLFDVDSSTPKVLATLINGGSTLNSLSSDLNTLKLGDVMDLNPGDLLYEARNESINDGDAIVDALLDNITLGDAITIDSSSPLVLQNLAGCKLSEVQGTLEGLTLAEIIDIDPSSSNILKSLAGVTVFGTGKNNLQYALENLNLLDLFGDDVFETGAGADSRNSIRIAIPVKDEDLDSSGNLKTTSFPATTGSAVTGRITADRTSLAGKVNFIFDKGKQVYFIDYLYNESSAYSTSSIDAAVKQGYQYLTGSAYGGTEVFSETNNEEPVSESGYDMTITSSKAKKFDTSYWFLFTESGEVFKDEYKKFLPKLGYTYTVNDMDKFVSNMNYHIRSERIRDLADAGYLDVNFNLDAVLKTNVYTYPIPHGGEKIGDLTISELLEVIEALVPLIAN